MIEENCTPCPAYAFTSPLALVWPLLTSPLWGVREDRRLEGRWVDGELVGRREELGARKEDDPPGTFRARLEIHCARPDRLLYALFISGRMVGAGGSDQLREVVEVLAREIGFAPDLCQTEATP